MADRGDVLRLKSRLGFAPKGEAESVVIVQSNGLNGVLPSFVVVPLDPVVALYAKHPAVVLVTAREAGSNVDHVAVVWRMRAVLADSFAVGAVGQLSSATLTALDRALRLVLDL